MLSPNLRGRLRRLEREAIIWRTEPIKRVAVRNALIRPVRARQFGAFGAKSFVDRPAWLYGTGHIAIGDGVMILRNGWLAVERTAWENTGPVLEIGNGVGVRLGCTLSAAKSVVIEDDVGMGAYVTVIDSAHGWEPGSYSPIYSPVKSAPIRIGRGTWLADRVSVTAGSQIGEQCAIGPNSVISGTIKDYSIVVGNPGRVVGSTRT